ncbi:MAG: hypothetical protein COA40_08225 [Aequorivita sp.]|nr:MAG: hypothetical protein COA40_08225 [Aequorivita sp.]
MILRIKAIPKKIKIKVFDNKILLFLVIIHKINTMARIYAHKSSFERIFSKFMNIVYKKTTREKRVVP